MTVEKIVAIAITLHLFLNMPEKGVFLGAKFALENLPATA